jgi:hypothetical protein
MNGGTTRVVRVTRKAKIYTVLTPCCSAWGGSGETLAIAAGTPQPEASFVAAVAGALATNGCGEKLVVEARM